MLPSPTELETSILAYFYNVRHFRDRTPDAMYEDVCEVTGMPKNSSTLKPSYRAVSGDSLALEVTPIPSDLAAAMMTVDTPSGERTYLNLKPRHLWTAEETEIHGELTYRIKLAAHRMAEEGWINLQPPDWDGNPQVFDETGMTARFQLTPRGLEAAKKKIRGTALESMKIGFAEALNTTQLAAAPEWVQAQKRHGDSINVQ